MKCQAEDSEKQINVDITIGGTSPLSDLSEFQRSILVGRSAGDCRDDLVHLSSVARDLVRGTDWPRYTHPLYTTPAYVTATDLLIGDHQVMQAWQQPLMGELANVVASSHGDVLEVGFGLGLGANAIQEMGVHSHTIVEAHPEVYEMLLRWRDRWSDRDIRTIEGRWQDLPQLGTFDAILFDPYPMSQEEFDNFWVSDVTYAAQGFSFAAKLLKQGGIFSYFSNEIDSVSRSHQRALLDHFSSLNIRRLDGLQPPGDCQYWWARSMVVIVATK